MSIQVNSAPLQVAVRENTIAVNTSNLESVLGDVYWAIYQNQRNCYQITCAMPFDKSDNAVCDVTVNLDNGSSQSLPAHKQFYSKQWYLSISPKYAPDTFDGITPSPLSGLETDNVNTIIAYEQQLMSSRDIYPNAGSVKLTSYDLCLSKDVLNMALAQIKTYPSTSTLQDNIKLLENATKRSDIQY
jgi:hypothetical protein